MKFAQAILLIFVAPVFAAWVSVQLVPDLLRLHTAIAVYFIATFVAISLEAQRDQGAFSTIKDALVASRIGLQAFVWWALIILSVIGIAWASTLRL